MSDAAVKTAPDWERIEADYRAGLLSVREIAASQGISHTAIQKRAKTDCWERDLSAKIKSKADALVAKREVAKEVATQRVETDKAIVDANAEVIANIRMAHRTDILRSRQLVMSLLGELEEQTGGIELYRQLGELMAAPDEKGVDKLNELYRKVISLSGRTGTMKSLSDSLKSLVTLEREAYGIADAQKIEMTGKLDQNVNHAGSIEHRSVSEISERVAELLGAGPAIDNPPSVPD